MKPAATRVPAPAQPCGRCGALVLDEHRAFHLDWHDGRDPDPAVPPPSAYDPTHRGDPTVRALPVLHDLPPRWDGRAVLWGPWQPPLPAHICPPPPPTCCPSCGRLEASRAQAVGLLAYDPDTTHADLIAWQSAKDVARALSIRDAPAMQEHLGRRRLIAFRCSSCGHDTVYDNHTRQEWDLDPDDYTTDGSREAGALPLDWAGDW